MSKNVYLVHGWEGKPDNHWFPWLTWELKTRGFEVYSLTMPSPAEPKVSEWIAEIKNIVGRPNKDTYFVGHSLGCLAILRYFEKLPKTARVGGAVFVAGFLSSLSISAIEEFCTPPLDVEKAKKHCERVVTIFSDNDGYVSMERSLEFQKALGAKGILERGKGHFTKSEGADALPSVFKSIVSFSE
ncbi:MAG: alpha/beta fold hydrolase [Candidatus Taylorbacteria bacterium]|nr:alpha/beta fold hydrolase [Candidatus Taylorbacteria bacterium]